MDRAGLDLAATDRAAMDQDPVWLRAGNLLRRPAARHRPKLDASLLPRCDADHRRKPGVHRRRRRREAHRRNVHPSVATAIARTGDPAVQRAKVAAAVLEINAARDGLTAIPHAIRIA